MNSCDNMRWFLMAAFLISLFTSILFLSLFSSPDMPVIPSWQVVGPDILSNFYDTHNEPWQEEDSSSKLLTSVASVVFCLSMIMILTLGW